MHYQCSFCDHANPPGAKFCNACGSPLNLKPCPKCDAINHDEVAVCHNCGANLRDPALEGILGAQHDIAAVAPSRTEHGDGHRSLPEAAADVMEMLHGSTMPDVRRSATQHIEVSPRVEGYGPYRSSGALSAIGHLGSASLPGRNNALLERHRALAAALLTSVLVVVFVLPLYYGYRHPAGIGSWLENRTVQAAFLSFRKHVEPAIAEGAFTQSETSAMASSTPAGAGLSQATSPSAAERAQRESPSNPTGDARSSDTASEVRIEPAPSIDAGAPAESKGTAADTAKAVPGSSVAVSHSNARREPKRRSAYTTASGEGTPMTTRGFPPDFSREQSRASATVSRCTDAVAALGLCNPASATGQ